MKGGEGPGRSRRHLVWVALLAASPWARAKTFRYIALGDFGTGGHKWGSVMEMACALQFHELAEDLDAQFTVSVGDNSYVPPLEGMRDSFEDTWNRKGSHGGGTWFPCVGNHDNAGPQFNYHSAATSSQKWVFPADHSTSVIDTGLGFDIQIWNVNSNDRGTGQRQWLHNTLAESKARWKIIVTHFPYINSGRHGREPAPQWIAQEAKEGGVQVFFNGHDHILQTSIYQGVAHVTTGAVARGGMMNRGIEQDKSKFVWTVGLKTSVPGHGMMSLQLTADVMWGTTWAFGGVVHEFVTVWDWPKVYQDHQPKGGGNKDTSFPDPEVIQSYLRKSAGSAPAPEPQQSAAPPPPEPAPAPVAPPPAVPPVPRMSAAKQRGLSMVAAGEAASQAQAQRDAAPPASAAERAVEQRPNASSLHSTRPAAAARYVVSTECAVCPGPSSGRQLTVWIQGADCGAGAYRVFLSLAERGCADATKPGGHSHAVPGAGQEVVPASCVVRYTPTAELRGGAAVFVCLSDNAGKSFVAVAQADSGLTPFTLWPRPPPSAAAAERPAGVANRNYQLMEAEALGEGGTSSSRSGTIFAFGAGAVLAAGCICLLDRRERRPAASPAAGPSCPAPPSGPA